MQLCQVIDGLRPCCLGFLVVESVCRWCCSLSLIALCWFSGFNLLFVIFGSILALCSFQFFLALEHLFLHLRLFWWWFGSCVGVLAFWNVCLCHSDIEYSQTVRALLRFVIGTLIFWLCWRPRFCLCCFWFFVQGLTFYFGLFWCYCAF